MEEQDIILGCKGNDRKSQKAFVDVYAPYLMGVCRRYISDTGLVKDCLQNSLIKILSKIDQYEEKGQFKSWIARIAVNECLMFIRKNKKHVFVDITDLNSASIAENSSFELEKDDVMKFLDLLPDNYRIALNMYLVEGYSHKEIGLKLSITESSSRSLVTRGRKKINEAFRKDNVRAIHNNKKNNKSFSIN